LPSPTTNRAICFLLAGTLYGAGALGIAIALGVAVKINVALMLLAIGTGFLVAGILLGTSHRPR
jgi:hypothetical protein